MNGDLISRSALLKKAEMRGHCLRPLVTAFHMCVDVKDIEKAPAVDAVEVVRCKDCVYWPKAKVNRKGFLICPARGMEITAKDFCSYGERRADNAD